MISPLVIYPSAANADGSIRYYPGASWAATHDATDGTDLYNTNNPFTCAAAYNSLNLIIRGFLPFDTSGIGSATILSATLTVTGTSKVGSEGSICLVASTQASTSTLATTDYDAVGTTELATAIPLSSWSTSGANTFTLNAAGLAHLNASGYTKFALRHSADLANTQPSTDNSAACYASEQSGTSSDPVLSVTLDIPAARTAALPKVTVFSPSAAPGAFGAYRGFGATTALPDGRLLCLAVKGSYHASSDSVVVGKYSSDNGATWDTSETSFPEIASCEITVLASGRLAALLDDFGAALRYPKYIYSDDDGASWTSGVTITWDFASGYAIPNDVIELANGDLIASAHGSDTPGGTQLLRFSKSTDDGATWTPLSSIAAIGGNNTVEQRCAVLANGDVYTVFHTEDGVPTDYYYAISTDDCATWGSPVLISAGDSWNRQGLTHFENDNLIIGVNDYSLFAWAYRESSDGGLNFNEPVQLDTPQLTWVPLKSAAVALKYSYGDSQQVGFTYSEEAADQQQAYTYYRQWSGVDGTIVNPKILEAATETDAAQVLSIAAPAGGSLGLLLTKVG